MTQLPALALLSLLTSALSGTLTECPLEFSRLKPPLLLTFTRTRSRVTVDDESEDSEIDNVRVLLDPEE